MANPVPFTLIQSDPSYVNGDLDTKRELFKIWYQVNKENIGEDEELNNGLLAAADEIREREDLGSTGWEIAGDVGISVGLGLGGAGLGLVTAGPPGAIVGGGAGGLAGADIVQRRELARGDKFDYSVARTLAEGAINMIPTAATVGRGFMPVVRAVAKDAGRVALGAAGGSIAEQVETRGTVDPLRVATDAAAAGVGASVLRGGFEAISKPMSRAARRKMSAAELNKLEEQLGRNELTNEEIARVIPYKEMMAEQGAAQEAAREQAMMDDEELASFIRMVQAEEPRQARGFTQDEQTAGLREVPTLGDIELANVEGPLEIARRTRPAVLSAQVFEEANQPKTAAEAAEILLPPDNIEATLSVDDDFIPPVASDTAGFNARVLEELNGFQIKGIPINAQTRQAAAAIARAETSAERGLLRQGVNDLFGQPKAPAPSVKRGTRLTSLADLELPVTQQAEQVPTPATAPSLANQADTAVAAGSLDNVNAEANKIAGAAPVAKQGPVGEQVLEEPAGLTIVTDPEDGSIFVEDGDGNTIDQFASKQDAEDYIAQLARGEDAPDLDEASAMGKTVLAGTDEVVPPAIEEPAGVIRTGPQRMVIEVEGEGKAENPKSKGWAKGRAEKRLRAIEKELDKLQNETLPVGESRRVRLRRDKKIAELNRRRDALERERLKIQSDMGDERAMASLARYEEDLAAGVKTPAQVIREAMDAGRVKLSRRFYVGEINDLLEKGLPKRFVAGKTEKGRSFDYIREQLNEALEENGYPTLELESDVINAIENAFSGGTGKRIEPKRVEMELPAANRGKEKAFAPVQQGDKVISVTSRDDTPTWQVTRFTDDGLEIPAGHNGHETLADALKDVKYAGDETKGVSSATAEDLAARFEAGKQNSGAVKPDSANNYFYSSPMRPLNGIKIKGTVQALSYKGKAGGLRGFLEMDRPLTLDEMAKFELVPINANSDSAYWNSLADAVYPDHAKVKAGKSARVSGAAPEAEKNLPAWARERMEQEGINPNRKFNDADLENQSMQDALALESPEALAAEGIVLKDGKYVYARKAVVDTEVDIPRVDLNKASAADVEKWADDVADYERNIDEKILGKELAAEYKRASRIANSSQYVASDSKVKEADAVIARIEESLTPEQSDIFFGRALPKGFIGKDDAKKFASAVSDIEGAEDMGELVMLTSGLGRAMIAARTGNGSLGPLDTALVARLGSKVKSLGGDEIDYIAGVVARRLDLDGADAPEILGITNEQAQQLLQEAANRKRGGGAPRAMPEISDSPLSLGIVGNSTLPSAGEPIIGAVAGFGLTQQEEGESDEAYQERRLQNALLGMGVMSLGAAGIRRLASKMGVEQAGIQLERLGAAAQSAAKPAAKKQTREELMAQVVKLNEIIAAQTKGTPYAGMAGPVIAAVQAGPSNGFDPAKKAAEIDAMNEGQRKGAEKTLKESASDTVRYFERKLVTANEAVYRMAELAERMAGRLLPASMDPRIITPTRGMNNQTQATAFIKESGLFGFVAKTLPAAAKAAGMDNKTFRSQLDKYLISKQALTRYAMGATEEEVGGGITKQVAADFVASLAPVMEPHAKFVNGIYRQLLEQSVKDDLVSRDLADWLVKVYPDYVPFSRIFDSDEIASGLTSAIRSGKSTASISGQTLVQKFLGSERGIESPLEEVFGRAYATFEQGGRNATARSWVNLGSSQWLGDSTGIKQLFRSAADGSPLRATGIFEEVNGGGYRMLDAQGQGVKDEFGQPVIVDRSYVDKTDQGNWVGNGQVVKDKAAAEKAKHKISFMHEGEKLEAEVPKEMEEAAKGLNVPAMGLFAKIMNLPVRVGRAGFTSLNPTFALRQIPRDTAQIIANTKEFRDIPKLLKNYGAGVKSAFASRIPEYAKMTGQPVDSELVKRWEQYGGRFNFTEQFRSPGETKVTVSRLMGDIPVSERPMQILRRVEDVVSAFEDMTRLAVFKTEVDRLAAPAIEQGLVKRSAKGILEGDQATLDDIFFKAAYESQERSANYLNKGEWGRALNGIFLYLNAGIQGTRANVKAFKQAPVAYALKAMVAGGAALATATAYNLATPERAKAYMDLTEDERNRNLILLHPMGLKDEEGNYIAMKLPLPQGVSGLAQTPRRIVEDMYGFAQAEGKPELFTAAASDLFGFVTPFEPDANKMLSFATPQAVRPVLESMDTVNRNFFSGQQVVPRYLQKLPPADQYKATTPLVAREIGAALNISPIKIDYLAKNYTGVIGSTAMWAADQAISAATGETTRTRSLAEDVKRAFTTTRGGEQLNRFYAEYERSAAIYEGIKSAMNKGDEERARELIKDNQEELRNYQVLNGINQKMTQLYSDIRTLESLVDKRPDLKDDIQLGRQQLTELARLGNQMVSEQK